jgi:hypothetical protein
MRPNTRSATRSSRRPLARSRPWRYGVSLALVGLTACTDADDTCVVGTLECQCTASSECDPGLTCSDNFCVGPGGAGAPAAGGAASTAGRRSGNRLTGLFARWWSRLVSLPVLHRGRSLLLWHPAVDPGVQLRRQQAGTDGPLRDPVRPGQAHLGRRNQHLEARRVEGCPSLLRSRNHLLWAPGQRRPLPGRSLPLGIRPHGDRARGHDRLVHQHHLYLHPRRTLLPEG